MSDGSKLILIVDDMKEIRVLLSEVLQSEGFETEAVSNGAEALAFLNGPRRPALIVLDLSMPVMCGREFLQRQRQDRRIADIPVIIFSGEPGVSVGEVRASSVICVISKHDKHEIVPAIRYAMTGSRPRFPER